MRHLLIILLAFILPPLIGCDGHARVLYLKPPKTVNPPWSVASVVIQIDGDEDILGIVSKVAKELEMIADQSTSNRWYIKSIKKNHSFYITVTKEEEGYWTVGLLDWPSLTRSEYSVRAEASIRNALRGAKTVGDAAIYQPVLRYTHATQPAK